MGFPPGDFRIFIRSEERGRPVPDAAEIQGHFEKYGDVLDVYRPPSSPDICYVTFPSEVEVGAAIAESRTVIAGLACNVQQAMPRGTTGPGVVATPSVYVPPTTYVPPASHRAYVAGLVEGVDEDVLKAYFSYFGAVKDVYIPVERSSGMKKPFAFVTMSTAEELQTVLQATTHHLAEGVAVNVTPAEPREGGKGGGHPSAAAVQQSSQWVSREAPSALEFRATTPKAAPAPASVPRPSCLQVSQEIERFGGGGAMAAQHKQGVPGPNRLFVFGMPEGLNADMLRGHFARHGELLDVYVPPRTPDIAYVTFSAEEELKDALENSGLRMAGYWVKGIKAAENREKGGGGWKGGGKMAGAPRPRPY